MYMVREYSHNTAFVKIACAMSKMHVIQNYDNDILEGLVVANPPLLNPKSIVFC